MMSSGLEEHGEHAVARAATVSESTPISFPKNVGTLDLAVTVSAFTVP
jgi:hypothetical protein